MLEDNNWIIRENRFNSDALNHKETIFTIGNGYLSTRGSFEEGYPGEESATLIHGVFDDVPIVFTELAIIPNWLSTVIYLDGERFSLNSGEITNYQRTLDLRDGMLTRIVRWRSPRGLAIDLRFERFTSLADPHLFALRIAVTPVNFSGEVRVHSAINGNVDNYGLAHWSWIDQEISETSAILYTRTRSSNIRLAMAMRLGVQGGAEVHQEGWDVDNQPTLIAAAQVAEGETITIEKVLSVFTSRDVGDPRKSAQSIMDRLPGASWETLRRANYKAWEREWSTSDVIIEGDEEAQLAVRFCIYQLLIAGSRNDECVSIGAKTLSGLGYRGHAFWDTEIFMLPFFTYTQPHIARNMLSYRYHNLPGAYRKASQNGFEGAQYPWESAATGDEVTPTWVPHSTDRDKLIRIWTGDIQIHISADIVFAIWQYWRLTGDEDFFLYRGVEVILATAKFWVSRAEWNDNLHRYEFNNVIGPDEYHDHVDNNAYTNYMVAWHLVKSLEVYNWLASNHPEIATALVDRMEISEEHLYKWRQVSSKIFQSWDAETNLIEQFDGYFRLQDVNLSDYDPRSQSMQEILGIEGVSQTQVIKQPDVLMLLYVLADQIDLPTLQANYEYYYPRTDHSYGSSLGPAIQAIVASKLGLHEEAYEHFLRAALMDLKDLRGNTRDGIHAATAGGVWQAITFGFAGLKVTQNKWEINPRLPSNWQRLAFKFYFRGEIQKVDITPEGFTESK